MMVFQRLGSAGARDVPYAADMHASGWLNTGQSSCFISLFSNYNFTKPGAPMKFFWFNAFYLRMKKRR